MPRWIVRLYRAYQKSWLRYILLPLFIAVPPAAVASADEFQLLKEFFGVNPTVKLVCHFWPVVLVPLNLVAQKLQAFSPVSVRELSTLGELINDIVGAKLERFGGHAVRFKNLGHAVSGGEVFLEITQPKEQIVLITECIWKYYKFMCDSPDISFKVALASMGPEFIDDFFCFFPRDKGPKGNKGKLRIEGAGFSRAKSTGKIHLVSDISKEVSSRKKSKGYAIMDESSLEEDGSMICFPIYHRPSDEIPYVISVVASEPGYFREARLKKDKIILETFAKRINIEHSLLILREVAVGEK